MIQCDFTGCLKQYQDTAANRYTLRIHKMVHELAASVIMSNVCDVCEIGRNNAYHLMKMKNKHKCELKPGLVKKIKENGYKQWIKVKPEEEILRCRFCKLNPIYMATERNAMEFHVKWQHGLELTEEMYFKKTADEITKVYPPKIKSYLKTIEKYKCSCGAEYDGLKDINLHWDDEHVNFHTKTYTIVKYSFKKRTGNAAQPPAKRQVLEHE